MSKSDVKVFQFIKEAFVYLVTHFYRYEKARFL